MSTTIYVIRTLGGVLPVTINTQSVPVTYSPIVLQRAAGTITMKRV